MQTFNTDIFIDAITLLIHINDDKSQRMIKDLLFIEKEKNKQLKQDAALMKFYIKLIEQIMIQHLTIENNPTELAMVLIKFKSDPTIQDNQEIYDRLHDIFTNNTKLDPNTIDYIYNRIHNTIIWYKCNIQVRKMFNSLNRYEDTSDPIEQKSFLANVLAASNIIQTTFAESPDREQGLVEHIDFTNINSLKSAYTKFHDRKVTGTLKLGLQGLNTMFGGKGPSLGESVVFNALQNNYKSGMLMSVAKWIVKYNEPPKHIEGKKPLILFITLENEAFENFMWWFRNTYELVTQESSLGVSEEKIVDYVHNYFNEKGYTFIIERYLPSEFSYNDLVRIYNKYESSGYYLISVIIDYMNCMNKSDTSSGKIGNYLLLKELYSNTCNFTKSKGTSLFTAHQLTREAGVIAHNGTANVVKQFDAIHMAGSYDVIREVDTSINMHKEINTNGEIYLTMYRNKRRYDDTTPEKDKYCAYKFTPYGIPDDVDGPSNVVKDIYAANKLKLPNGQGSGITDIGSMF